jgi:hypothetical protein
VLQGEEEVVASRLDPDAHRKLPKRGIVKSVKLGGVPEAHHLVVEDLMELADAPDDDLPLRALVEGDALAS